MNPAEIRPGSLISSPEATLRGCRGVGRLRGAEVSAAAGSRAAREGRRLLRCRGRLPRQLLGHTLNVRDPEVPYFFCFKSRPGNLLFLGSTRPFPSQN